MFSDFLFLYSDMLTLLSGLDFVSFMAEHCDFLSVSLIFNVCMCVCVWVCVHKHSVIFFYFSLFPIEDRIWPFFFFLFGRFYFIFLITPNLNFQKEVPNYGD